jgi:ferredoxin--NADP+ reductase
LWYNYWVQFTPCYYCVDFIFIRTGIIVFRILEKQKLAAQVFRFVVEAPDIARKVQAGQFVILRLDERGERIPLTISDARTEQGSIILFVQVVGKTSTQMSELNVGDSILDVAGPLGNPSEISHFGTVVLVGGGFGIAAIYPIARELSRCGNTTMSILGARTRELILLLKEMKSVSRQVLVATNDGSSGRKGLVTDELQRLIDEGESIDRVIAIGPPVMMKAVAELTRPYGIKTIVSMNPIMIDGTGMCGACRVNVGGEMKFACIDGPEFDGHAVDFEGLLNRLKTYVPEEQESRDKWMIEHREPCRLT